MPVSRLLIFCDGLVALMPTLIVRVNSWSKLIGYHVHTQVLEHGRLGAGLRQQDVIGLVLLLEQHQLAQHRFDPGLDERLERVGAHFVGIRCQYLHAANGLVQPAIGRHGRLGHIPGDLVEVHVQAILLLVRRRRSVSSLRHLHVLVDIGQHGRRQARYGSGRISTCLLRFTKYRLFMANFRCRCAD